MEAEKVVKDKKTINLMHLRDKDRVPVKGIFRFHEVPGGQMEFSLLLHKGDKLTNYKFKDGEIQTVPLGVAKHLNQNCWYPEYDHIKGEDSQNAAVITKKIRRCSFQSLEFIDIDDFRETPAPIERTM